MKEKLIVLDWDGVCNGIGGPGIRWNARGVADLADCIAEVKGITPEYGFAVLTGRDYRYGLAIVEALGLLETNPGLVSGFENGLILGAHTVPWTLRILEIVTEEYLKVRERLGEHLRPIIASAGGKEEAKDVMLTFNPPGGMAIGAFYTFLLAKIEGMYSLELVHCSHSNSAVDFGPKGGGKEDTIISLCSANGIALDQAFYIGDGSSDIEAFKKVGRSGAPDNASEKVKEAASVVAKEAAPWGTVALIRHHVFGDKWGIEGIEPE